MERKTYRAPDLFGAAELKAAFTANGTVLSAARWVIRRPYRQPQPLSLRDLGWRAALAWGVFIGRYDAIRWE